MVRALDSGSNGPGSSFCRGTALCFWARHFTLILLLSSQVNKWVPANLLLGVTLNGLASHPGGAEILLKSLHATETGISSGLMGHLARMQT